MKKRLVSLVLAVTLCLSLLPGTVLAAGGEAVQSAVERIKKIGAGGDVTYISAPSRYYQVPILSATMMNDSNILNEYVYKNGGLLNGGSRFTRYDYNSVNMATPPYYLSDAYDWSFQRINDNSTWRARYKMDVWGDFATLARSGQLSYLFSAELKYDRHMKAGKHAHVIFRDFAVARLYSGYESNQYMELINNKHQPEESWNFMSSGWSRIPTDVKSDLTLFFWHDEGDRCWDGASGVRKAAIAFGDDVYPYVTKAEVLNSGQTYYNSGSFDFKIYFSEPIRTSDASSEIASNSPAARIRLAAYDRETRQSQEIYADLTSTGSNSLTYRFNVPTDKPVDIIITGIAGADFQRDTILSRNQDLKVYTSNRTYETIYRNGTAIKVNATYTDYAGNGIDEAWRAVSFPQEIHIDTVAPTYTNTVIESGSMIRDQDFDELIDGWNDQADKGWAATPEIDRSQVFAGVGDWLNLAVDFSEELRKIDGTGAAYGSEDGEHFTATLNIIDKDTNENVKLQGSTVFSMQTAINNNTPISRLRFKTLAITDKMAPDTTNPGPIKIISITTDKGDTVYDMCGNQLDLASLTSETLWTPDKQEILDTVAPTAQATGFEKEERDSTPDSWATDGVPTSGIKLKLQVLESSLDGVDDATKAQYRSGTAGVGDSGTDGTQGPGHLTISGVGAAKYQYAVTLDLEGPESPNAEDWVTVTGDAGLNFAQLDNPVTLHIRMAEDSQVPIFGFDYTIDGYDYAGNPSTSESQHVDLQNYAEQDIALYEHTAPTSTANFTAELKSDGTKEAISSFTVTDLGGLTEVWYKQVNHPTGVDKIDDDNVITAENMDDPYNSNPIPGDEEYSWEQVKNADGSDLTGENLSILVPNVRTEVELRKNNWVYLCIYAKDRSGNVLKQVYSFRQDMRMPKYDITVPDEITNLEDPDTYVKIGLMYVDQAKQIGPVNVWGSVNGRWVWQYGALFVTLNQEQQNPDNRTLTKMVDWLIDSELIPDDQLGNTYKKASDDNDPIRDSRFTAIDNLFGDLMSAEYGATVTSDERTHSVTMPLGWRAFTDGKINEMIKNRLSTPDIDYTGDEKFDIFTGDNYSGINESTFARYKSNYYGNLDIIMTQTVSQLTNNDIVQFYQQNESKSGYKDANSKPVYVDQYVIKMKMDDGNTDGNPINVAKFHAPIASNGQLLARDGAEADSYIPLDNVDVRISTTGTDFDPSNTDMAAEKSEITFSTLAGITVPFTVGNHRVQEWGTEDIDFENSKVEVIFDPATVETVSGGVQFKHTDSQVVYTQNGLTPDSTEQTFTFPEKLDGGEDYKTGIYSIRVTLRTKSFVNDDVFDVSEKPAAEGGFLFRVCTMAPSDIGGVYSSVIADGVSLEENGVHLTPVISDAKFEGGSFDAEPMGEYVIPMIEEFDAEGASKYDYYYPFFTYQNQYVNDNPDECDPAASLFFKLKVWQEGENGSEKNAKYLDITDHYSDAYSIFKAPFGNGVNLNSNGFSFGVICDYSEKSSAVADHDHSFYYAHVNAGENVVICMQEYYANGQVGSIRKLTVGAPGIPEEDEKDADGTVTMKYAHITPTIDMAGYTGIPTETFTIGVNDISSVNGVDKIYIASYDTYDYGMYTDWYSAEVDETTNTKLLKIGEYTEFTNPDGSMNTSPDEARYVIYSLVYRSYNGTFYMGYPYKDPVVIAIDANYNTTVKQVKDFARDWDPYTPVMDAFSTDSSQGKYTLSGGSYSTDIHISDKFMPGSPNDVMFYITTINPDTITDDGEELDKNEGATKTIAIPLGDIINGEGEYGIYDGSTPNAPGVTKIVLKGGNVLDYGIDRSGTGMSALQGYLRPYSATRAK